ncbi:unnamed protein product [Musa acuminata var. zebrina]
MFQQAVLRAGPLLQIVMSAGPLPSRHPQVPSAAINPDLLVCNHEQPSRRFHASAGWCRMKPAAPLRTLPSTQMSSLQDE